MANLSVTILISNTDNLKNKISAATLSYEYKAFIKYLKIGVDTISLSP